MSSSVEKMYDAQRRLSFAQSVPIVGPLIFSPVKAIVSTAQIIAGLASAIFWGIGFCLTEDYFISSRLQEATIHVGMGCGSLAYSFVNFVTYGLVGFTAEWIFVPSIKPIF